MHRARLVVPSALLKRERSRVPPLALRRLCERPSKGQKDRRRSIFVAEHVGPLTKNASPWQSHWGWLGHNICPACCRRFVPHARAYCRGSSRHYSRSKLL
eukprot:146246-Pyramimonas_sp.AAC.1